ncbi:tyrosine-type recombinase/integrase [Christensenella tenuis]|jgi:integrase/recombinase XerD|uniref:Integrase SAM-like N-terminal domain-containing protein n=1 Tax=Christensenella tenuis TaxID=2763033 RepID=A0ABR7ECS1_9FIRM|nr:site-specific integrase [Christensenella tenuis]MBC5647572.1 hypothetical protein [Christensenella tenuis]
MEITLKKLKHGTQEYLDVLAKKGLAGSTFNVYARNLAYMNGYFEHECGLHGITPEDVAEFRAHVEAKYKNATAINIIGITNRLFRFMHEERFCIRNIRKKQPERLPEVLTRAEYKKLLAAAAREDSKLYYIIRTVAGTGINYSDLEFITVDAVKNGYANAERSGKAWDIVISRNLQEVLSQYCRENGIKNGIIFYGRGMNRIIDRAYICRQLKILGGMVKIDESKLTMRALRLFFSYMYLQSENNIFELNELLGNKMYAARQILPSRSISEKSRTLAKLGL